MSLPDTSIVCMCFFLVFLCVVMATVCTPVACTYHTWIYVINFMAQTYQGWRSKCGWSGHCRTNYFLNDVMLPVMWVGLGQVQKNSNEIFKVVSCPQSDFNCECVKKKKKSCFLDAPNARAL